MSEKTKNQKYLGLLIVAVLAIAAVSYMYTSQPTTGWDWKQVFGVTPTPLGQTPTPPPTQNPTATPPPTPTPTPWNPDNPTPTPSPTPITTTQPIADVWQSLYITNLDGSVPYWVNAPAPYKAMTIIAHNGQSWTAVKDVSNNIWANVNLNGLSVASWTFTCTETITINAIGSGATVGSAYGTLASSQVSGAGASLVSGQTVWVTGASLSAANLKPYIDSAVAGHNLGSAYACFYVVNLSQMQFTMHLTNGQTWTLTANPSTQNTLAWLINIS